MNNVVLNLIKELRCKTSRCVYNLQLDSIDLTEPRCTCVSQIMSKKELIKLYKYLSYAATLIREAVKEGKK